MLIHNIMGTFSNIFKIGKNGFSLKNESSYCQVKDTNGTNLHLLKAKDLHFNDGKVLKSKYYVITQATASGEIVLDYFSNATLKSIVVKVISESTTGPGEMIEITDGDGVSIDQTTIDLYSQGVYKLEDIYKQYTGLMKLIFIKTGDLHDFEAIIWIEYA